MGSDPGNSTDPSLILATNRWDYGLVLQDDGRMALLWLGDAENPQVVMTSQSPELARDMFGAITAELWRRHGPTG